MITNLTEGKIKTRLIISIGVAAIIVMGIGSHAAFAVKVKKNSFQDGYNAGFAAGKKDRINNNEFDSKPPKGHSDAYDEGYRRGYDDAMFRGEHFSSNSAAASSSAVAVGSDGGHKHKHSAAATSSAAAGGASAASSSAAAAGGGSAAASSSSAASS